jgi:hypothetical protein
MNDTVGKIFMYVELNIITNGRTDKATHVLHGIFRKAGSDMKIKVIKFKVWDKCRRTHCNEMKIDAKLALKDYKTRTMKIVRADTIA